MQNQGIHSSGSDTLAVMTKDDVIALAKAKVSDDIILSQIKASGSHFRLSTQDIVSLTNAGVSSKVIDAMIKTDEQSQHAEASGGSTAYYPGYWYDYDPFWDPWYPSFYVGYAGGFFRPVYRYYGFSGFYGGHGFRGRH
jgi:hypothetical protein